LFEILEKALHVPAVREAELVQVRGQKRRIVVCAIKNGFVENFSDISLSGVGTRVLTEGGSWGFSSTNILEPESVKQTLMSALKLARAVKKPRSQVIPKLTPIVADETAPVEKRVDELDAEEILKIPLEAHNGAKEAGEHVADVKATYLSMEDDRFFMDSEGSHIHQGTVRVLLFVDVIAKRNGLLCPVSENPGHTGGLELFDRFPPYELGNSLGREALQLLDAKAPPAGKFRSIIHPTLCATMLHEAVGHPLEADLAMFGGGFSNKIGEEVSSELVTIYDDGLVPGGLGYFAYDDEGVECPRTTLIEQGVLRGYMHDRTSAVKAGVEPTGNAHAWDYSVEPLIRQTNIGLEPGGFTVEEMVDDVKDGFLLEGTFGGQADTSGDFTFGFQSAKRIKGGRLREKLRGANVAGNAIEVFKTIDAIGNAAILRPGACGKDQFAVQGRVAPIIRCEIMIGGTGRR